MFELFDLLAKIFVFLSFTIAACVPAEVIIKNLQEFESHWTVMYINGSCQFEDIPLNISAETSWGITNNVSFDTCTFEAVYTIPECTGTCANLEAVRITIKYYSFLAVASVSPLQQSDENDDPYFYLNVPDDYNWTNESLQIDWTNESLQIDWTNNSIILRGSIVPSGQFVFDQIDIMISEVPSSSTTEEPTSSTTVEPTSSTTVEPTPSTTVEPTSSTTEEPTSSTTEEPTSSTTVEPTSSTTVEPTSSTTVEPTSSTTVEPTSSTTVDPTSSTTVEPTSSTTLEPTSSTTVEPTSSTTLKPTSSTTVEPTSSTTEEPTSSTTEEPTSSTIVETTSSTTEEPTSSTTVEPSPSTTVASTRYSSNASESASSSTPLYPSDPVSTNLPETSPNTPITSTTTTSRVPIDNPDSNNDRSIRDMFLYIVLPIATLLGIIIAGFSYAYFTPCGRGSWFMPNKTPRSALSVGQQTTSAPSQVQVQARRISRFSKTFTSRFLIPRAHVNHASSVPYRKHV